MATSDLLINGFKRNAILFILFIIGFFYLFATKVSTGEIDSLKQEQSKLQDSVVEVQKSQARIEGQIEALAQHLTGKKKFNGEKKKWPPGEYMVGVIDIPPDGWDSVKVGVIRKATQTRPPWICYYTDPFDRLVITELE